jgi:DNA (cytosine-5)-methyltransferase 1
MKIKVFTAFSGYDSQCMALDRLKENHPDFDYDLVGWSEIDKYAIQAHDAIYPQWADRNFGDVSKIDWSQVPDFDFFTYSFPCQSISTAGYQKGLSEGSNTRSSLLWECRKAIVAKKPKYLFLENVKALVCAKFVKDFALWLNELESYGYRNYWQVVDAVDYGVPQHRERVFVFSILDDPTPYIFPKPMPLDKCINDILEDEVDENYFIQKDKVRDFVKNNKDNVEKAVQEEMGNQCQ